MSPIISPVRKGMTCMPEYHQVACVQFAFEKKDPKVFSAGRIVLITILF